MDWLTFCIMAALLGASAFFAASETALTGASRGSMLRLSKQGNRDADLVSQLIANRERLIGALLLGNNIANIGASALATNVFTGWFGEVGVLYATARHDRAGRDLRRSACRRPSPSTRPIASRLRSRVRCGSPCTCSGRCLR